MRLEHLVSGPASSPKTTKLAVDPEIDAMLDALFADALSPTWKDSTHSSTPTDTAVSPAVCNRDTARAA